MAVYPTGHTQSVGTQTALSRGMHRSSHVLPQKYAFHLLTQRAPEGVDIAISPNSSDSKPAAPNSRTSQTAADTASILTRRAGSWEEVDVSHPTGHTGTTVPTLLGEPLPTANMPST